MLFRANLAAGKPCGNGFPMAGLVTSPRLAQAFANGMEFFATFGKMSCLQNTFLHAHNLDLLLLGPAQLLSMASAPFHATCCVAPAGGCTVAPACGLAVLEVMREEGLQANATRVGAHCLELLRELQVTRIRTNMNMVHSAGA
jgi:4-aminobutyrate aminotransferase-like enzyme